MVAVGRRSRSCQSGAECFEVCSPSLSSSYLRMATYAAAMESSQLPGTGGVVGASSVPPGADASKSLLYDYDSDSESSLSSLSDSEDTSSEFQNDVPEEEDEDSVGELSRVVARPFWR